MAIKFIWLGLFLFLVLPAFVVGMPLELVGAIIMGIGVVLLLANR